MKKMEKIAVLGGGNGAHTLAADLALKGLGVTICESPEYEATFRRTLEEQGVTLTDIWGETRFARFTATTDFGQALKGVDYIMVCVPAMGHMHFFNATLPYLEDGQTIVIWPGNYGALRFANLLHEKRIQKRLTFAEANTLPWGCRFEGAGAVRMFVEVWKLLVGALPSAEVGRVARDLAVICPTASGANVLASSLNNLNPIVHPVGSILNAGWIDTLGKDFYFYRYGTTLSIARAIKAIYEEISKVAEAIGVEMLEYPEKAFFSKGTIMCHYNRAPFDTEGMAAQISGPSSMKARYVSEDVPYGLVPLGLLARQLGISTPVLDAVTALGSVINQTNYWETGLSPEQLGIAGLDRIQLKRLLERGFE